MKTTPIAALATLALLTACNGSPVPEATPSAVAANATAEAANATNPDDDPIEPVAENEAEHGHSHGEDADHKH